LLEQYRVVVDVETIENDLDQEILIVVIVDLEGEVIPLTSFTAYRNDNKL
jgi:hypothetical protein